MALKDIIGQEKAIDILSKTLQRNRMPSAYLFAGESGIGKKFTAVNFAKTLNCQNNRLSAISYQLSDCCDECPSCKKINARTHPDFLMVLPEKGEIRVDEIREIEELLSFSPYEGKIKVVIVDDAETMNASAANAFLKTLEEPPPKSLIILVSASPDRLPETIRSRCSRINFSPLSPADCEEVIKKTSPPPHFSAPALSLVARLSMGRPGLAISTDLMEERNWFIELFREMRACSKEQWTDKEEIEKWFNFAFIMLRDIAVLKVTGTENMLINLDLKDKIAGLSKIMELKDIIESYFRLSFLKGYLGFNLNKSITWNHTGFILRKFGRGI